MGKCIWVHAYGYMHMGKCVEKCIWGTSLLHLLPRPRKLACCWLSLIMKCSWEHTYTFASAHRKVIKKSHQWMHSALSLLKLMNWTLCYYAARVLLAKCYTKEALSVLKPMNWTSCYYVTMLRVCCGQNAFPRKPTHCVHRKPTHCVRVHMSAHTHTGGSGGVCVGWIAWIRLFACLCSPTWTR